MFWISCKLYEKSSKTLKNVMDQSVASVPMEILFKYYKSKLKYIYVFYFGLIFDELLNCILFKISFHLHILYLILKDNHWVSTDTWEKCTDTTL